MVFININSSYRNLQHAPFGMPHVRLVDRRLDLVSIDGDEEPMDASAKNPTIEAQSMFRILYAAICAFSFGASLALACWISRATGVGLMT